MIVDVLDALGGFGVGWLFATVLAVCCFLVSYIWLGCVLALFAGLLLIC